MASKCRLFQGATGHDSNKSQANHSRVVPERNKQLVLPFMFVDYQTERHQKTALIKEKQSFIQRVYNRNQKLLRLEKLRSSTATTKTALTEKENAADNILTSSISHENEQHQIEDQTADGAKNESNHQVNEPPAIWSLKEYFGQGFVDPFSSHGIQMSDSMNMYFGHFRVHTIYSCYPLDSARMSVWWWQKAIAQPGLLQALLFLAADHQAALESDNNASPSAVTRSTRDSLKLRGQTIQTLKDVITNSKKALTESTILIVGSLVAIEAVEANWQALDAHSSGLKKLIELHGGLDALDHMTVAKIYQSDVKMAALKDSRPTFPMSARWRSEILQEAKLYQSKSNLEVPEVLSLLATRFFTAPWSAKIGETMQNHIRIFRQLVAYYELAREQPKLIMPTDNDLFLLFEYELLSVRYDVASDYIQESLRLTLLIYSNSRIWSFQAFPFMRFIVKSLRQSLDDHFVDYLASAPDLLFWVLFIGGMAAQKTSNRAWFVHGLVNTMRYLKLTDWDMTKELLKGFFYADRHADEMVDELWMEIRNDRTSFW